MILKDLIVAVDFDGTCVRHEFPLVGEEVVHCIHTLKRMQAAGAKIILNTMRGGPYLAAALAWLEERGIELYGINENPTQKEGTDSPKAYAHLYIDDAALGCPLTKGSGRPHVNWFAVERLVFSKTHHIEVIHPK